MGKTLNDLVQRALSENSENVAVSYYEGSWCYLTYSQLALGSNEVFEELKSLILEELKLEGFDVYVGLRLRVTKVFPSVVLGILQLGCGFVCFDKTEKHKSSQDLISRLNIPLILSNTSDNHGLRLIKTVNILGEILTIWDSGVRGMSKWALPMAYGIQTSGSTGRPKLVQVPHCAILPNILHLSEIFEITNKDVIYFGTPETFDPSVVELFLALSNGATLCIVEESLRKDLNSLASILFCKEKGGVTILQTTPSLFKRWSINSIQGVIFHPETTLRILVLGGEAFPDLKSWSIPQNVLVYNIYGITEVSCWATISRCDLNSERASIGEPILESQLELRYCDEHNIGRMFIGSETRICAIDDENLSNLLEAKPIFRDTGDLFKEENGRYFFVGRNDSVVKRFGVKINTAEIENAALHYKGISSCACVSTSLNDRCRISLFVVEHQGFELEDFKKYLSQELPKGSMPDSVETMAKLPLTRHGKINTAALRNMMKKRPKEKPSSVLKELWQQYTDGKEPKHEVGFITNGGNSFSALQLVEELEFRTGFVSKSLLGCLLKDTSFRECSRDLEVNKKSSVTGKVIKVSDINDSVVSSDTVVNIELSKSLKSVSNWGPKVGLSQLWKHHLGKCVDATPTLLELNEKEIVVIIGSHSGVVVVLNLNSGDVVSSTKLPNRIESSACVSPSRRHYFIGCYNGCMYKIEVKSGMIRWSFRTRDMIKSRAVTMGESLFFGSYDKYLYSIKCECGELNWKTELKGGILASPVICKEMDMILATTLYGEISALNISTGQVIWQEFLPPVFSTPAVDGKEIIVAPVKGKLLWFALTSGQKLREYKAEGMVFSSLVQHPYEDGSNLLLFTSHDEFIYCLQGSRLLWRTKLSSKGVASPALFRRELVVVPSTSGVLYILTLSDGQIVAEFSLPNETFSSPVIWDSRIVIGCRDDYVHCLEIDY